MKLKVLHVVATPFPANQGTAGAIRELVYALFKRGHEIHVVTYYQGQNNIELPDIRIHRIPRLGKLHDFFVGFTYKRPLFDLALAFKTLRVARRIRPHIIHAYHHEATLAASLARLITRIPMIYHCVASMEEELPLFLRPGFLFRKVGKLLDVFIPRLADYCVAVSKDLVDSICRSGFPRENVFYLPTTIDANTMINGNGAIFRERYGMVSNPIVVYTGVINEFQGIDNLLKSMTVVVRELPSTKLVMAISMFDEIGVKKYKTLASELGLRGNVVFLEGFPFSELPEVLAAEDVAVMPRGKCAGLPVKLLNYMAAGKPVASMRGGSAQLIEDGKNGLLADSWEELGEKILVLLKDNKLAQRLGEAGVMDLAKFTPDGAAEKMEQIYMSLLKKIPNSTHTDFSDDI